MSANSFHTHKYCTTSTWKHVDNNVKIGTLLASTSYVQSKSVSRSTAVKNCSVQS